MEECLPQLEVFEDQFWDVDLAFEASGGLAFLDTAEKMSGCGDDISDVVKRTMMVLILEAVVYPPEIRLVMESTQAMFWI